MEYLIAFLEGIITFLSPCLLPMIPIYLSYFAGGAERTGKKALVGSLGFVLGFTLLFMAMGVLAGTFGSFLRQYQTWVDLVCGGIVIFFGLHFLGVFRLQLFRGAGASSPKDVGFFSAMVFGITFSVSWTPCVGAFLGSALMLASQQGHVLRGAFMLLSYSVGLGIPFILSALVLDHLRSTFDWVKKHYRLINIISGSFLILIGILMATGMLGKWFALLS